VNNPTPQQLGRPYYGSTNRLDKAYNNIQMVSSSGWSSYYGVQFTLEKRFSDGYSLRANYILSESKDDGSDFTQAEQPNDPYNRAAERSFSAEHQRHRVTLTGVWELPYGRNPNAEGNPVLLGVFGGWTGSMTFTYRSGTAENPSSAQTSTPTATAAQIGRSSTGSWPNGTLTWGRLRGREPAHVQEVPVRRSTALLLQFEAFNLFNRTNYSGVNMTWGTALDPRSTYGTYTSASAPRQLQLGVKFEF